MQSSFFLDVGLILTSFVYFYVCAAILKGFFRAQVVRLSGYVTVCTAVVAVEHWQTLTLAFCKFYIIYNQNSKMCLQ